MRSMNYKPHTHTKRGTDGWMLVVKVTCSFQIFTYHAMDREIRSLFTDNVEEAFRVEIDKHSWYRICMVWEKHKHSMEKNVLSVYLL